MKGKLLELLAENSSRSLAELAALLHCSEEEVGQAIADLEHDNIITGYYAGINWQKANVERLKAIIELKIKPQSAHGFDAIARKIAAIPEVQTLRLLSGTYDLMVEIDGRTFYEVAGIVSSRLATIEGVESTTTHFMLKTYKENGVLMVGDEHDQRLAVTP
ncbi:MAG: Lrp/AsnC family transcriptional regulator [Negativicutes bacterium]|nr:Lrp/AsnC family transcriptional regulator [Negativicutes bacterium]